MKIKKEVQRGIVEYVIKRFEKEMKREADPLECWIMENSVNIALKIIRKDGTTK